MDEIMQRLDESFAPALKDMERRQKQAAAMAEGAQQAPVEPLPEPVDYLRQQQNQEYEYMKKPRLNGSTQKVSVDVNTAIAMLKPLFKKAKDDSERFTKVGDKEGARIAKEQYMRDVFFPTVEALVGENSPEEVINATKALKELDKYAFSAAGNSDGFTGSFVANLYQYDTGNVLPTSDIDVQRSLQSIVSLVQNDQIRAAVGLAKKIKDRIDSGEHTASKEDYELIQKVALRGQ